VFGAIVGGGEGDHAGAWVRLDDLAGRGDAAHHEHVEDTPMIADATQPNK
jgi:hypothetical protein